MKITTKTYAAATLTSLALLMLALTASGQTTNIIIANFDTDTEVTGPPWGNWFGGAFQSVAFDSSDASNNASSGSLLITGVFSGAGQQYMVYNQNNGINPAILSPDPTTGYTVTNFQCDIRFDPSSCTNPAGNYGVLNFGSRGTGFDQPMFGTVPVPSGQTNWVHVSLPVNVLATPAWSSIPDVLIQLHTFGAAMSGTSKLYVDNIKFVSGLLPSPPPTMSIVKAGPPGLRVFAGSTGTIYDREGLATADPSQSWIGGTYPVSYSLKILSYPTDVNIAQTHIFLVPVNSSPVGAYGYNGVDYVATNGLWLTINPRPGGGTNGVTATVSWKTNLPNANPFETGVTELRITNSTAVGTWTLTFNNETNGTLTAPGASPAPFIISDSSVATDFANPVVAYFGLQPNGVAGEGEFEDWG